MIPESFFPDYNPVKRMSLAFAAGLNSNQDMLRTYASLFARNIIHNQNNFEYKNTINNFKKINYLKINEDKSNKKYVNNIVNLEHNKEILKSRSRTPEKEISTNNEIQQSVNKNNVETNINNTNN